MRVLPLLLVVLVVPLLGGCFNAGIQPRTGDLAQGGTVTAGGTFVIAGYAPGTFRSADGGSSTGDSAQRAVTDFLSAMFGYFLWEVTGAVRWAPVDGLEVGGSLGIQQQALELRGALLDEDRGAPISLAVSGMAAWRPIYDLHAGWYAVGLDVSRRFGVVAPLIDVYVSYGAERHAIRLDADQDPGCGSFGDPGCGEYGPGRHLVSLRDEVRLTFAAGASIEVGDNAWLTFAVSPYWIAWAADPGALTCFGCDQFIDPVDFDESWGIHFTIGAMYGRYRP